MSVNVKSFYTYKKISLFNVARICLYSVYLYIYVTADICGLTQGLKIHTDTSK